MTSHPEPGNPFSSDPRLSPREAWKLEDRCAFCHKVYGRLTTIYLFPCGHTVCNLCFDARLVPVRPPGAGHCPKCGSCIYRQDICNAKSCPHRVALRHYHLGDPDKVGDADEEEAFFCKRGQRHLDSCSRCFAELRLREWTAEARSSWVLATQQQQQKDDDGGEGDLLYAVMPNTGLHGLLPGEGSPRRDDEDVVELGQMADAKSRLLRSLLSKMGPDPYLPQRERPTIAFRVRRC